MSAELERLKNFSTPADTLVGGVTVLLLVGGMTWALSMIIATLADTDNMLSPFQEWFSMFRNPEARTFNEDASDEEKQSRQQARGTIASLITSVIFVGINYALDVGGNVDRATSTALVGMGFGGTLGFLMDISVGSDVGFRKLQEDGLMKSWKYALSSLVTSSYARYILTVLFDLFVSMILFKPAFQTLVGLPYFGRNKSMANVIVSGLIGVITFQCYANATRFLWAYPSETLEDRTTLIRGSTMQIAIGLACAVYLAVDTQVEGPDAPGLNHPTVKLLLVIATMLYIAVLNNNDALDATIDEGDDLDDDEDDLGNMEEKDKKYEDGSPEYESYSVQGALMLVLIGLGFGGYTLTTGKDVSLERKVGVFVVWSVAVLTFAYPGLASVFA